MSENPIHKDIQVRSSDKTEEGHVILPYDKTQFNDFIKSLLGSPQSLNRNYEGPFEINIDDLSQLYALIYQRVTQQNEGILARFQAKIMFSDSSSVELSSIQELVSYNEVKPIHVVGIHLIWDFIVKFNDKDFPEKQKIVVSFVTAIKGISNIMFNQDSKVTNFSHSGIINVRIEHTARTWASDIDALISNHIGNITSQPERIKKWVYMNSALIGKVVSFIIAIIVLGGAGKVITYKSNYLSQMYDSLIGIENKFDYFIKVIYLQSATQMIYLIGYTFLGGILSGILGAIVDKAARYQESSFILINKESHKHKAKIIKANQNDFIKTLLRIIGSIVLGVISSIIFEMFYK